MLHCDPWFAYIPKQITQIADSLGVNSILLDQENEYCLGSKKELVELNLKNLHLQTLPVDLFDDFPYIKDLTISNNGIDYLPPNIFSKLKNLESLHIFEPISYKDYSIINFENLSKLKELGIVSNWPILAISEMLTKVDKLNLYTSLEKLRKELFYGFDGLSELKIMAPSLKQIDMDSLSSLKQLKFLELEIDPSIVPENLLTLTRSFLPELYDLRINGSWIYDY